MAVRGKVTPGSLLASLLVALILGGGILFLETFADRERSSKTTSTVQAHVGLKCPKCGGEMQRGFVVDYTHAGKEISAWIPGEPQVDMLGELKDNDKDRVELLLGVFKIRLTGVLDGRN
jgi:hypothetical protein